MDRKEIIDGLKMTMELCVFDPSTGEEIEPHLLNDMNRATYDACKGALEILGRIDTDTDTISRQAVIDIALQYCPDDDGVCSKAGCDPREMLDEIEALPPAQPQQITTQLTADDVETIRIHLSAIKGNLCNQHRWNEAKEYEALIDRLTVQPAQHIDADGTLWITVTDIEQVKRVIVDEDKSKFCRQFYMDAQPEIIRCMECKYGVLDSGFPHQHFCSFKGNEWNNADYYCGHAERRET